MYGAHMTKQNRSNISKTDTRQIRENSTGWIIKSLGGWLDKQMESGLKSLGLSMGQFAIMMTLLERDGLTQVEIGRRLSMPGSATTRHIDRLEELEFVKRQQHETSRRSYRICVTDKGVAIAPHLYTLITEVNEQFLASLSDTNKKDFQAILEKLYMTICH